MQAEHSPFPTDETLAAYIDGRLDGEARRDVEAHMAECAECRDVLAATSEFEAKPVVVRGVNWTRNGFIGLAAAAAVAFALFLSPLRDRIWPRDGLRELAAAAPNERASDGRVFGFPYQQRAPTFRGSKDHEQPVNFDNVKFTTAASKVHTLHATGVAELVLDEQDKGVPNLERAAKEARSPDAPLLNDLAAAYIAAQRFADAANAADRAWKLSHAPEIAWNRAVAAEHVEPPAAAIAKWNEYLNLEPDSRWKAEANKRVERLREYP